MERAGSRAVVRTAPSAVIHRWVQHGVLASLTFLVLFPAHPLGAADATPAASVAADGQQQLPEEVRNAFARVTSAEVFRLDEDFDSHVFLMNGHFVEFPGTGIYYNHFIYRILGGPIPTQKAQTLALVELVHQAGAGEDEFKGKKMLWNFAPIVGIRLFGVDDAGGERALGVILLSFESCDVVYTGDLSVKDHCYPYHVTRKMNTVGGTALLAALKGLFPKDPLIQGMVYGYGNHPSSTASALKP